MSRRFRPPAISVLGDGPDADSARALSQAREEAFAEGRALGLREGHEVGQRAGQEVARAAYEAELASVRDELAKHQARLAVSDALERILDQRAADLAAVDDAARDALVTALATVFPLLLEQAAGQEIVALVSASLTERDPEILHLRACPATLEAVADQLPLEGSGGRLAIQPDPGLRFGTVEIGWTGGGLLFEPAALLTRIAAILAPAQKDPTP